MCYITCKIFTITMRQTELLRTSFISVDTLILENVVDVFSASATTQLLCKHAHTHTAIVFLAVTNVQHRIQRHLRLYPHQMVSFVVSRAKLTIRCTVQKFLVWRQNSVDFFVFKRLGISISQSQACIFSIDQSQACIFSISQSQACIFSMSQSQACIFSMSQSQACIFP